MCKPMSLSSLKDHSKTHIRHLVSIFQSMIGHYISSNYSESVMILYTYRR